MSMPRLTDSFTNLAPSALTALTGAPWWGIALIMLLHLVIQTFPQHVRILVQARNEARRGRREGQLLGQLPRRHALQGLTHIRQAREEVSAPPGPPSAPADPPALGPPATPT